MKPQIDKRYNYILTNQIGIQKTKCFNLIGYNFSMDVTNPTNNSKFLKIKLKVKRSVRYNNRT